MDSIQLSEIGKLNLRKDKFTPELNRVYMTSGGVSTYAKITNIDYTREFPYSCAVMERPAIAINGSVQAQAIWRETSCDFSGRSIDNVETFLCNTDSGDIAANYASDIDMLNSRRFPVQKEVDAFASSSPDWDKGQDNRSALFLLIGLAFVCIGMIMEQSSVPWYFQLFITFGGMFASFVFLAIILFFIKEAHMENRACEFLETCFDGQKNSRFNISNKTIFLTKYKKTVVIENKFGKDIVYPMEGYVIEKTGIMDGDTIISEAIVKPMKWNYSGQPENGNRDFILFNTDEDKAFFRSNLLLPT